VGERRSVLAYAKAGAIKRSEARDKGDEDVYKDTSNAVQIGEWLLQRMVFLPEITVQEYWQRRAICRPQRICEAAWVT